MSLGYLHKIRFFRKKTLECASKKQSDVDSSHNSAAKIDENLRAIYIFSNNKILMQYNQSKYNN